MREAERLDARASAVALAEPPAAWSTERATALYDVARWGAGYFSVGDNGHVFVHPSREPSPAVDLLELVESLGLRGIEPPILLRFGGILQDRIEALHHSFDRAIREHDYRGSYCSVYPIKVNQQRQVVEEIQHVGGQFGLGFGLEAGSKAELLTLLAIAGNDTPIICNGFKDDEYIEAVLLAQKIGRRITPVVERAVELDMVVEYARLHGLRPTIGVRVKLASTGSGRWKESAGYGSKFGLSVAETLAAVERLQREGMADCLHLLHFHVGSQITNIRHVKSAVAEAGRLYVELHRLGAGLRYLDVGGGLGVDYDGSQSDFESSINYTLQEYANDIIYHVMNVCDEAGIEHPAILTEAGRAMTAYHSVLVFNVLGLSSDQGIDIPETLPEEAPQPLWDLLDTYRSLRPRTVVEGFHDAEQALEQALHLFSLGYLSLRDRGLAETLYWRICRRIYELLRELDFVPEELRELDRRIARTYFCNFSLFQSLPDSWAIDQLFPIMPIHRLDEEPALRGVLADISCDSDGKIDHFIDRAEVKNTLPLHDPADRPYYLGVFLVGAYQEILGDLHNLLGDTHAVHISTDDAGAVMIEDVVKGDTVREVLQYVQFDGDALLRSFRRDVEAAVRNGLISVPESGQLLRFYEHGLQGYTYLEDGRSEPPR